jgi:hypothetical protein
VIFDLVVPLILGVLNALLSLAPTWTMPNGLDASAGTLGGYLRMMNFFVPVGDLLVALVAVLAFRAALSAWHLVMFIYNKIPWLAHS